MLSHNARGDNTLGKLVGTERESSSFRTPPFGIRTMISENAFPFPPPIFVPLFALSLLIPD